ELTLIVQLHFSVLFFFSSRSLHTSFSRDWSSDVCSSDLIEVEGNGEDPADAVMSELRRMAGEYGWYATTGTLCILFSQRYSEDRSEERRVGKVGSTWGSQYQWRRLIRTRKPASDKYRKCS